MAENTPRAHKNRHPRTSRRFRSGIPLVGVFLLPLALPLGYTLAVRPGNQPADSILSLMALVLICVAAASELGFHLQTMGLRRNSTVFIASGHTKLRTLIQILALLLEALGLWVLTLNNLPVPPFVVCGVLACLAVFSLTQGSGAAVQYWLKTCVILENRVIAYEDVESIVQIPWQGFDIRLQGQTTAIEVRRKNAETDRLMDALKPVLVPYGIRLQLHSARN